jgi:hypothetical protein
LYSVLTDSSRQMGDAAETVGESTGASLASLDKLLEHRSRLAACVLLSNADRLSFSRLKELLKSGCASSEAGRRRVCHSGKEVREPAACQLVRVVETGQEGAQDTPGGFGSLDQAVVGLAGVDPKVESLARC